MRFPPISLRSEWRLRVWSAPETRFGRHYTELPGYEWTVARSRRPDFSQLGNWVNPLQRELANRYAGEVKPTRGWGIGADAVASDARETIRLLSQGRTTMAGGERNLGRLTPMVLTGALAVLIGALLWGLTDMSGVSLIVLVILILAIGLFGVVMLDRRRSVA